MSKQIFINMKETTFTFDRIEAIDKLMNRDKEKIKNNIEILLSKPYVKNYCKKFLEYILENNLWDKVIFQDDSIIFAIEFEFVPLMDSVLMIAAEYDSFDDTKYRERLSDIILDEDKHDEKMYELLDELEIIPIRLNSNSDYRAKEMRNILSKIPVIDYIDLNEENYLREMKEYTEDMIERLKSGKKDYDIDNDPQKEYVYDINSLGKEFNIDFNIKW